MILQLFTYIRKLIEAQDYVVVPGFGGFVARYRPASIHPVNNEFRPPDKTLAFNRNLTEDDGLLRAILIKSEGLAPNEARKRIEEFSRQLLQDLEEKKMISMPGIGRIYVDIEGRVRFRQDEDSHLLPASFGLPVFTANPILRKAIVDTRPALSVAEDEIPSHKPKIPLWGWIAAAIFAGILLLTALFSITPLNHQARELMGWTPDSAIYVEAEAAPALSINDIDWMIAHIELSPVQKLPPEVQMPYEVSVNHDIPKGYFVVVGSFSKSKRAQKYSDKLRQENWKVFVFPQSENGFYRVAIYISDSNPFETSQMLREIRQTYQPDAWVVKNEK